MDGGWPSTKTTRPINPNMQYSNCKLTIPFKTSTSNKLINKNVCTSMCTWSTSTKHLESRTMPWFWWMSLATSTRTTKPIDQLQITQSACIHFNTHQKQRIHRKKHKRVNYHKSREDFRSPLRSGLSSITYKATRSVFGGWKLFHLPKPPWSVERD